MSSSEQDEIRRLKSQIAALEELLSVQERTVLEQSQRLEQALAQAIDATRAKTVLLAAVEQSPSSVVITDVRGNIEYVNPEFIELTGYPLEEVLGKNPRILKSGEHSAEMYEQLWRTITAGGDWRGEFHNRKKNGELYLESAVISPIRNAQGVITHFVAVKEDITKRRRAEEALREREELFSDSLSERSVRHDVSGGGHRNLAGERPFLSDAGILGAGSAGKFMAESYPPGRLGHFAAGPGPNASWPGSYSGY